MQATLDKFLGNIQRAAAALGKKKQPRAEDASLNEDQHLGRSSVPALSQFEVLHFDGKDASGNPTPEAQLKKHVLGESSEKVTVAAGEISPGHTGPTNGVEGMAGVGKTVALKGLGAEKDIQEAFQEMHFITVGRDATPFSVVSELARIVQISGGQQLSAQVRNSKDIDTAVQLVVEWFSGIKCLFLVDDLWETTSNKYGYFPCLRRLLASCEDSRMVITTRDWNIANEVGQIVKFGTRDMATSREIFMSYFQGAFD